MSDAGDLQNNIANIRKPDNFFFNQAVKDAHAAKPATPPAQPTEPVPPPNLKQSIAAGLKKCRRNCPSLQLRSFNGRVHYR